MNHDYAMQALDRSIEMPEGEQLDEVACAEDSLERPLLSDFLEIVRAWKSLIYKAHFFENRVHVSPVYPYAIVRLTQGYFAVIDASLARKAARYLWSASVQTGANGQITHVYAVSRTPLKGKGKYRRLYLHRYLAGAGDCVVINHFNRLTLDCRLVNLIPGDTGGNNRHIDRSTWGRTSNPGLKRGVERLGAALFGGKIEIKGKAVRSRRKWSDPERPAVWYRRVHRLAFKHDCATVAIQKADWPVLPDLLISKKQGMRLMKKAPKPCKQRALVAEDANCPF